jgi:hypothetical protein
MTPPLEKRGLLIFLLIIVIIAIVALAANRITGPLGIEERFSRAVGLPAPAEETGNGVFGFSVEGNPAAYGAFLGVLILLCLFLLRWKRKGNG